MNVLIHKHQKLWLWRLLKLAECELLECDKTCATCSNGACTAVGQTCLDADISSTSDWTCTCVAPAVGSATAKVAECVCDECKACPSQNDFTCECQPPSIDNAVGAAAVCTFDECKVHAPNCTAIGQYCNDPDLLNDNTWVCHCLPPNVEVGRDMSNAKNAICELDECTIMNCPTCANTTCTAVGQTCADVNKDPTSTSDWTCTCVAPAVGSATAKIAECVCDECLTSPTCTTASQACYDADKTCPSQNDFTCECQPPSIDNAVGAAAVCTFDECKVHAPNCTAIGQYCNTTTEWTR